jgi:hypothetical protein
MDTCGKWRGFTGSWWRVVAVRRWGDVGEARG